MANAFRNVYVTTGELSFNQYDRPLWRSCNWCGGVGIYVVSRTSKLTDRVYSDHACDRCAAEWREHADGGDQAALFFPDDLGDTGGFTDLIESACPHDKALTSCTRIERERSAA